jgi:hypothetical protein
MRAFVVHRTYKRNAAKKALSSIAKQRGIELHLFFLKASYGSSWKGRAESEIDNSEIVIVFDPDSCSTSPNTRWEIERAKEIGKTTIEIFPESDNREQIDLLCAAYDFSEDFERCFAKLNGSSEHLWNLYKSMLETSEQLIQRRQITNGFFTTLIGGLVAASGFVVKEDVVAASDYWLLLLPIMGGLVLCRSWRKLIDNYGKLNRGKFKVLLRLEREFDAEIFAAEWIALGKGLRPSRYQSFTETERNVPLLFMGILAFIGVFVIIRTDWTPAVDTTLSLLSFVKRFVGC